MACEVLADLVVEALEAGRDGAVRDVVETHARDCVVCRERKGTLSAMAEGLDPPMETVRPGFVSRVMAEIRGEERHSGAYDRLPPLWQIGGAAALFVALAAVVLAAHPGGETWHGRALTGFLDQALVFLGGLSTGVRGLWDAVVPGRGLPILVGLAIAATALNVALVVRVLKRDTVEEDS